MYCIRIEADLFQHGIVYRSCYITDPSGFELFSALWEAHTLNTSRTERSTAAGIHLQTPLAISGFGLFVGSVFRHTLFRVHTSH